MSQPVKGSPFRRSQKPELLAGSIFKNDSVHLFPFFKQVIYHLGLTANALPGVKVIVRIRVLRSGRGMCKKTRRQVQGQPAPLNKCCGYMESRPELSYAHLLIKMLGL